MSEYKPDAEENARFLAICNGLEEPEADCVLEGCSAHEAGLAFHECPYAREGVAALSWRIGWNARALEQR